MKQINWKKIWPHVAAIAAFLIIAIIYCQPALQGNVLQQADVTHWKGMAQDALNYKAVHGHLPLWNTHLFSGMPNYQVAMEGKHFGPNFGTWLSLGLPKPISFFFLACVCFYILGMTFGFNVLIATLCSLAFAYATYDPVIIVAGHETKMFAIAYMPLVLAGIALLFNKKYWWGVLVLTIGLVAEIGANHPQITYYLLLTVVIMSIFYLVKWIKAGEWKHIGIVIAAGLIASAIGVGSSALPLMTTYEYSKFTMRGGKTMDIKGGNDIKQISKTAGLDQDYAFMWSVSKAEPFVLLMPNAFGGSSADAFDEDSKVAAAFSEIGASPQYAAQMPKYWGGLEGTSGPAYSGALICFLAIIGFGISGVDKTNKWWIAVATIFGIILACGKFLPGINNFLFHVLPMYNKFRAPSMALVIPQLLLPIMAGLTLSEVNTEKVKDALLKNFKPILYAAGGLFALGLLVYFMNDYSSAMDEQLKTAFGSADHAKPILNALMAERKAMFGAGLLHALLFGAFAIGGIFLIVKKIVSPHIVLIAFIVINTVDLLVVDNKYLNNSLFQPADDVASANFTPTPAEQQILQDKDPHYRVLNLSTGDPFQDAITSYHLRSIGGYHAAKLRIYQDLIESQFSGKGGLNMSVLNMLDTKYVIVGSQQQGQQQPQQNGGTVQQNPEALGAAWFVKDIQYVNSPVEALKSLEHFNPKDTAIVDQSFKTAVGTPVYDSSAKIQLVQYTNDTIQYKTTAKTPQFAVLSEIYYPKGWNAYLDGKKVDYANVNYVLRGIAVPAGTHTIDFRFEPRSYYLGDTISYISNILYCLVILISIIFLVKKSRKKTLTVAS